MTEPRPPATFVRLGGDVVFLTTPLPGRLLLEAFDRRGGAAFVRLCAEGPAHAALLRFLAGAGSGFFSLDFRRNPEEDLSLAVEVRLQRAPPRPGGPLSEMARLMAECRARRAEGLPGVWLQELKPAPSPHRPMPLVSVTWEKGLCDLGRTSWVAHQCNCTSVGARGLAKALFALRPDADTYSRRESPNVPGAVDAFPGPPGEAGVLNLYAQVHPGWPGAFEASDSAARRLELFNECLTEIERRVLSGELGDCSLGIAFPWKIGCTLGGGDWKRYLPLLEAFAARVPCPVLIVRRPGDGI